MKTRRLLYVDDDAAIRLLVKRIFEKKYPAYEVILAASAEEALAELSRRRDGTEYPQAIITDLRLGSQTDGAALLETIRAEFPKVRAVMVSAITLRDDVQRAVKAGAQAFLEKDLSVQAFVDRLFDVIQCPTDALPAMQAS